MIISLGMPAIASVTVDQGTLLSATTDNLFDGRPGTLTVFETPASTSDTLRFTIDFAQPFDVSVYPFLFARVDNVRTAVSIDTEVGVTLVGPSIAYALTPVANNGIGYPARTILAQRSIFSPSFLSITGVQIDVKNNIANSQVSIGEVCVSAAVDIGIEKYSQTLVDPSTTRRSSGNQPWPMFRIPFRKGVASFSNTSYDNALGTGDGIENLQEFLYGATTAGAVGIIPFWRADRRYALDQTMIDKNSFLARIVDIAGIEGIAAERRWTAGVTCEELL